MPSTYQADNLLYAASCLRLNLATSDSIQEALDATRDGRSDSTGEHLVKAGSLSEDVHLLLLSLIEAQKKTHGGSAERCLEQFTQSALSERMISNWTEGDQQTIDFSGPASNGADVDLVTCADSANFRPTVATERFMKLVKHSQGGMGELYRARDMQLNRLVALKQMHPHCVEQESLRDRFFFEGQVTGRLEHPGIVPVYAMGENSDKLPYYVMRYIDGETMTDAIRRLHSSEEVDLNRSNEEFRNLLARFVDACYAIDYAHSRGVLHRDLKPDNIMLGKFQETLVVDWGLAAGGRPTDADVDAAHQVLDDNLNRRQQETMAGTALGTPNYMSPEQARGNLDAIGPATDIFNLGASLFHLLTRSAPIKGTSTESILYQASKCDFTNPRELVKHVPPPLEAIVLKAMAPDPANRYETAGQLAADVERWLADEPVAAYPEPFTDRVVRWVRRNRGLAASIAGSVLLLSVVLGFATWMINQERQEKATLATEKSQLAEKEQEARAESDQRFLESRQTVDTWLTSFSDASRYVPAVQPLREDLLEQAAEEYERFAREKLNNPDIEIERGLTLLRLAEVYRELRRLDDSLEAVQRAQAVLEPLAKADAATAEATLAVALCHHRRALAQLAKGELEPADVSLGRCIELAEGVTDKDHQAERLELLAAALNNRGELQLAKSDIKAAEATFREAADLADELGRLAPDSVRHHSTVAKTYLGLGKVSLANGESEAGSGVSGAGC